MSDKPVKSYFTCWFASDEQSDEINRLRTELEDTKMKLDWARKEIKRLRSTNTTETPAISTASSANRDANADYSYATMIVHRDATQSSELHKMQEIVKQKQEQRRPQSSSEYMKLSDHDEDEEADENETVSNTQKTAMKKTINRLSIMVQENEHEKHAMMQSNKQKDDIIRAKEKQIAELKQQIEELKQSNATSGSPPTPTRSASGRKRNSFSLSLNQSILEMEQNKQSNSKTHTINVPVYDEDEEEEKSDSQTKTNGAEKRTKDDAETARRKKKARSHYDNVDEQIEILNNAQLKEKSLALLAEKLRISKSSADTGVVTFFTKYLNEKTVSQIFEKSGKAQQSDPNLILSATGLVNVLSFSVILYKVKVHQVMNGKERPKIDNAEIKNTVKYLAIWIVRTYGMKAQEEDKYVDSASGRSYDVYRFKLSKEQFAVKISEYLKEFAKQQGKHSDSHL